MNRRELLVASGTMLVAGCAGGSDSNPATSTPTQTATPTPSPEPTTELTPTEEEETPTIQQQTASPEPPEVKMVNLISEFEEFGDVEENKIPSAPQSSNILIGYRHEIWVHDGQIATTAEVRIFNSQGNRVALDRRQEEQFTEGDGPSTWDAAVAFTADWEPGEYEAEVTLRDDITDKVSDSETGTFEITKPEPKLEVLSSQIYRETYSSGVSGIAKNVSDDELSYAEVSVIFLDGDGRQLDSGLDNTSDLAPGREWSFDASYLGDGEFEDYEIKTDWTV